MANYKLLPGSGPHIQDGKSYNPGDEIDSEAELDKLFPGKFQRADGKEQDEERAERADNRTPYDVPETQRAVPANQAIDTEDDEDEEEASEDGEKKPRRRRSSR